MLGRADRRGIWLQQEEGGEAGQWGAAAAQALPSRASFELRMNEGWGWAQVCTGLREEQGS